jgi:hypothetical protein
VSSRRVLVVAIALAVTLAAASVAAAAAAAEAPRWKVISTTSPTNLEPNSPREEVQEVAVDATGGTFTLGVSEVQCQEGAPQPTEPIPYDASASEVQAALEGLSCDVGAGGVSVTGGPGGSSAYVVTFTGEHANERIPAMTADDTELSGAGAHVSVAEAVRGAFVPYLTVTAINVGGASTDGSTITLADTLPAALSARTITGYDAYASGLAENGEGSAAMSCSSLPTTSCSYTGAVEPGDMLVMRVTLNVGEATAPSSNQVTVSGGGAAEASASAPVTISDTPAPFGPVPDSVIAALSTNQAGAHANVTSAFTMATSETDAVPSDAKDVRFDLPPGLVGEAVGMAQCTMGKVLALEREPNGCPSDTMVGMATLTINTQGGAGGGDGTRVVPVYNIAPASGEPAAFALDAIKLPVRLDTSVLSDGNYAVRVTAPSITEAASTLAVAITIWGVPADHSGPGEGKSLFTLFGGGSFGGPNPSQTMVALLSNPQQCNEALLAEMSTDSWKSPGAYVSSGPVAMGALENCAQLTLEPSFTMLPDTLEAAAPAGYSFALRVPQDDEPEGLAPSSVKDVKLTLPPGTVISPSAAWGLKACSDAQFFGGERGESEPARLGNCPPEAQIGTVEVKTPALALPLQGQVYLAEPECGDAGICSPEDAQAGRMLRLFLQVADEGESPVVIKLEGRGSVDQANGQITTTFENNPQLPFSELKLKLDGGARATLANPRACGAVASSLELTPWSSPFTPDATGTYGFEVNRGCFGPQFDPSFVAGTTNVQAGAYSPFVLSFTRRDQDESFNTVQVQLPPGLLASIANVPLCPEPQAAQGTCAQESRIGDAQSLVGPGAEPFLVSGGEVFLTTGYKGAPFGLSVVVPAKAGPYTLSGTTGNGTIVVRAAVNVNPSTAAVTATSDPLPTVLDGIPLQLKSVEVAIDRERFVFNPTNCDRTAIQGTFSGGEGAVAALSTPFEAANCAALPFKPSFTAETQAKTSKLDGASLVVKITQRPGESNIHRVDLQLPVVLPSRNSTLNKACTEAQFNASPAGCPEGSVIGTATARSPVLQAPLTGPAYLVSHGGEAFPDVEYVLQADERGGDVEIVLDGKTQIRKGITYSHFETVPDAPISSFETDLPEGPHSIFSTEYPGVTNLCALQLLMPTAIVGQNGAQITQNTKIAVRGCRALTISERKLSGRSVTLAFNLTVKGTVTVTAPGLKRYRKSLSPGIHRIELALSTKGLSLRARHRKIKIEVALHSGRSTSRTSTTLKL